MGMPDNRSRPTSSAVRMTGRLVSMNSHPTLKVLAREGVRPISIFTGYDYRVKDEDTQEDHDEHNTHTDGEQEGAPV